MNRLRKVTGAALLTVAASACSGGGGGGMTLDLIAHSADRAAEAGTARFEMTMEVSGPGVPERAAITGTGAYDNARQVAEFTMQMSGAANASVGGDVSFDIVAAGTILYMNFGPMADLAGFATPWVSFDLTNLEGLSDLFGASTSPMGTDPSQSLAFLRGADNVEELDRVDVREVPTTHYRARADLGDTLADLPSAQREVLEPQIETLRDAGLDELPIEVWIDDDGLPRRMRTTMDFPESGDDIPAGTAMSIEIDFFDFGEPVSITVPPADQVTDIRELLGTFGSP